MRNEADNLYMRRCLELAGKALGRTYPNPVVGSVIVNEGRIIGEGFHLKAGDAHAEVNAIESVTDRSLLGKSTLYVNLEPCSHYGRTPPCAERIIAEGIPRVVIGTGDTSDIVAGRGAEMLRDAGCEVITGVCEEESRSINRRFFTFHEKKRPYVILKWAMSADGFIDINRPPGSPVEPYWITGMTERVLVHRWRATEQVIVAGGGTVRTDNPALNVRYWAGPDPVKVIISRSGRLDSTSRVFQGDSGVLLFTTGTDLSFPGTRVFTISGRQKDTADEVLETLYNLGYQSVFIEGGRKVLDMFIGSGKWDEARIFRGFASWGEGLPAPAISGRKESITHFKGSLLETIHNEDIR
ncbi:MAG: bifunctional diaminohydroxyphosphoribosylaminopyrimidine deaminase/5-amino-6-(5-phosphoribosylamino)uracil reductase RibD [Bacteroidales bacterium]